MRRLIKIDNNKWARCGECGHKLFKVKDNLSFTELQGLKKSGIEIKCHSCKLINTFGGEQSASRT